MENKATGQMETNACHDMIDSFDLNLMNIHLLLRVHGYQSYKKFIFFFVFSMEHVYECLAFPFRFGISTYGPHLIEPIIFFLKVDLRVCKCMYWIFNDKRYMNNQ